MVSAHSEQVSTTIEERMQYNLLCYLRCTVWGEYWLKLWCHRAKMIIKQTRCKSRSKSLRLNLSGTWELGRLTATVLLLLAFVLQVSMLQSSSFKQLPILTQTKVMSAKEEASTKKQFKSGLICSTADGKKFTQCASVSGALAFVVRRPSRSRNKKRNSF